MFWKGYPFAINIVQQNYLVVKKNFLLCRFAAFPATILKAHGQVAVSVDLGTAMNLDVTYPRRQTTPCKIGPLIIGGGYPVMVQSMITEETRNVEACVEQIIAL